MTPRERRDSAWLQTATGRAFVFADPRPHLADIAWSLAGQPRYLAHTRRTYSVAEHSIRVAGYLERTYGDPLLVLAGLVHDAGEAYYGDVPSPVKWAAGELWAHEWRELTEPIDHAIADLVGCPRERLKDSRLKEADVRILNNEHRALMAPPPRPWNTGEPLEGVEIPAVYGHSYVWSRHHAVARAWLEALAAHVRPEIVLPALRELPGIGR